MKKRTFLPEKQTLSEALSFIHPSFKPLSSIISKQTLESFSTQLQTFCAQTYILREQQNSIAQTYFPKKQEVKNFKEVLNENIRQLLALSKNNFVQCLAHQYKDYSLVLKNFNFGKTIIEESMFEELTEILGVQFAIQVVYNYIVIMKYEDNYFQVTGVPLPETYNFKAFGQRKKKVQGNRHTYNISHQTIDRFHILYCSHTNRNSGLFRRNIFFDKGVSKSQYFQQVKILVEKQVGMMFKKGILKPEELTRVQEHIFNLFTACRKIFQIKHCTNQKYSYDKMVCDFDQLLAKYCKLPENYKQMRKKVNEYEIGNQSSVEQLFEEMYKAQTSYRQVFLLLKDLLRKVVPEGLLGLQNFTIFIDMLKDFIAMKRYENYKIQDIVFKMNVFSLPWLKLNYNKKFKKQIIGKGRRIIASIVVLLFNKLVVPILKYNFYVTQKHKEANKLFYYRKPLWVLISKLALKKFSEMNLESITETQYTEIRKKGIDHPEGKLRLMPKKGTFRPIITFNRKRKVQGDFYKANLNQILADTQLVLRNLKNLLGEKIGFCIFDNKQISKKYDAFVEKWRSKGCPQMVYFTLDIKKCYDSIDTTKLIKIIEDTPYIQQIYLLIKYLRLYRNKKPLQEIQSLPNYFNFKERAHAVSFQQNIMGIKEESHAAINIFPGKQKVITKEEINRKLKQLCDGSIISYKKQHWLQKVGIPQGLNVSGVLCSLYFAYLQEEYVEVNEGLLMRLTDDYLYIGPQTEAVQVLNSLLQCSEANKFVFNSEKINKNFYHPNVEKISDSKQVVWIGKKINIETLQISPVYEFGSDKLAYAMNVNINRKHIKSFLKNKLKSLLTNQFASYFKPKIFGIDHLCENIGLYCKISLAKFFPFLISLHKLHIPNETELILKILQLTIHQFLVYACCFIKESERNYIYHRFLVVVLSELAIFLKQKRSFSFLRKIQKIFVYRQKKYLCALKDFQKFHEITHYDKFLGIPDQ